MKQLYWRPRGISRSVLVLLALISLLGLGVVELVQTRQKQPHFTEKLRAAQLALEGMEIIKAERLRKNPVMDPEVDPAQSGLIGMLMTDVTTATAPLSAKQTSVNPNFAAVLLEMLLEAGVRQGDVVAVGCSGSFPSLNVCAYAAVRTLKLRPIIISSATASQFGANDPNLLWIDMEHLLYEKDRQNFPFRSVAVSPGGVEDRAIGISQAGRQHIQAAIERNGLKPLKPRDFKDSIDKRMAIYAQYAGDAPIKAYINVGAGTVSVGTTLGKRMFRPGLSLPRAAAPRYIDSVMSRFLDDGVPVIHLVHVERLAARYGMPVQPTIMPVPGEGAVFYREERNRWLAVGTLVVIIGSLYLFVRSQLGYRILQTNHKQQEDLVTEPMV